MYCAMMESCFKVATVEEAKARRVPWVSSQGFAAESSNAKRCIFPMRNPPHI